MANLFTRIRQLDYDKVCSSLPMANEPETTYPEVYTLRESGSSKLHDFVSACHRHLGQNRLGPGEALTENAKSILVELMIRWVDPRQRDSLPTLEQTALESARVMLRKHHTADTKTSAEWVIQVLEFYEKYYNAKSNDISDPQIAPDTENATALDIIREFKSRAHEFTFDPEQQKLRYPNSVPTQATAPANPAPHAILTHPLITAAPRCRRRTRDQDVGGTDVNNTFGAGFTFNRV